MTEKGKKMAESIAEFIMMRYFFPNLNGDRKKFMRCNDEFKKDMGFNLQNGKVNRTTDKFLINKVKVNTN